MRVPHGKQGLLIGLIVLALVAAACGNNASATTSGGATTTPTPTPSPASSTGGGSPTMAPTTTKTVIEGPGNSFAFMPSTIKVTQGTTLKLDNVSDAAHTFTVTEQGIDVET
jgi:plastocyanin